MTNNFSERSVSLSSVLCSLFLKDRGRKSRGEIGPHLDVVLLQYKDHI